MRKRSVIVECDKVRKLVEDKAQEWNSQSLNKVTTKDVLEKAGIESSLTRTLNNWESRNPHVSTLQALADVLEVKIEAITKQPPTILDLSDPNDPDTYCHDLIVSAIHTEKFMTTLAEQEDSNKFCIGRFLEEEFRAELQYGDIGLQTLEKNLHEACRIGWLTDLKDPVRFVINPWNKDDCLVAETIRFKIEAMAIRHALDLRKECLAEYEFIVATQNATINQLQEATLQLIDEPTIERAVKVIFKDCKFHQGWAGNQRNYNLHLRYAIGGHIQAIYKLIDSYRTLQRLKKPLPDTVVPLTGLVKHFHPEIEVIFRKFRDGSFHEVVKELKKHNGNGWQFINEIGQALGA